MTDLSPTMRILIYNEILDDFKETKSIRASCARIQQKHGIEGSTNAFRAWFYRFKQNDCKNHGNQIFSIQQEQCFVAFLEAWSLLNRGLTRKLFLNYVSTLHPQVANWDPKNWFSSFMNRYSHALSFRTVKGLSSNRANVDNVEHVKHFTSWLEKNVFNAENDDFILINADETRLQIEGNQHFLKRIESTSKPKFTGLDMVRGKSATFVPFHTPEGMIMSVYVIAASFGTSGEFIIRKAGKTAKQNYAVYYIFNDNGWMNRNTWASIIEVFIKEVNEKFPLRRKILMLDRLSCHMTIENLEVFQGSSVDVVFFPANVTHAIQPSDADILKTFKKCIYQRLSSQLVLKRPNQRHLGTEILNIAQEMEHVISPSVIASSWKKTGLYPYNKEIILNNLSIKNKKKQDDASKDIVTQVRDMTMKMITDHLGNNTSTHVRVTPEKNKMFTGQELIMLHDSNSKAKVSASTNSNNEDDNVIGLSKSSAAPKKRQSPDFQCTCTLHNQENELMENDDSRCTSCFTYVFCNTCYGLHVEEFLMHIDACEEKMKKKQKRIR